jgi:hypothetical protein
MHSVVKRAFLIILAVVLLIFLLRSFILDFAFQRFVSKVESRYGFHIAAADKKTTGFTGVQLLNLVVLPAQGDTLLQADSVYLRPSLFNLLIGKIRLNELSIANMHIHFSCKDSACNYAIVKEKNEEGKQPDAETDYAQLAKQLFKDAFDFLPQQMTLSNVNVHLDKDSIHEDITIPFFESSDEELHGTLSDNLTGAQWNISGTLSARNKTFDVKIFPEQQNSKGLPLVKNFFGAYCNFDSLQIVLSETDFGAPLKCKGVLRAFNLQALHPKLSDDTITVTDFTQYFSVSIGTNFLELDSASYIQLNKLPLTVYARYDKNPEKNYSLVIKSGMQDAAHFFTSLPGGMFSELQDIEADGSLDYTLRFHLDASEPDRLDFDSKMEKKKFRLKNYGSLLKLNAPFIYTAYERNRPVASFMVGPDNPDFVPIDKISPYLKNAVLTSEDGSFFYHNGFNEDAFRKSIAANYKAGKFVRGGSTITMQLVKNVFLTRHKTIARKVEEAFLVWLIESNNLCTKERMFEVYLNIIELGPGVYGVKNASQFYFDKNPDELSLSESIFLASLLPHPKWFKYSFDAAGNLKPYLADYYRVVSNFMLKKGLITEEEYNRIEPRVELKGPAKAIVIPTDTNPEEYMDESQY